MASSEVVSNRNLRELLDALCAKHDPRRPGLPLPVMAGLARLVPGALVSVCELDLAAEEVLVNQEFPDAGAAEYFDDESDRFWWSCFWQNRFCSQFEPLDERLGVHRLSDYYTPGELQRTAGFGEFFREPDVAYELMVCLTPGLGRSARILFARGAGDRDFTDEDLLLLALLRPHLQALWLGLEKARTAKVGLTAREAQVLALVAEGRRNAEIAALLFVSVATVRKHLEHAYDKLGVRTRTAAASLVSAPSQRSARTG